MKKYYGESHILIYANQKSASNFFPVNKVRFDRQKVKLVIGEVHSSAEYKPQSNKIIQIDLRGFDFDELQRFSPVQWEKSSHLLPFSGKKVIISRVFARNHQLKAGDNFNLYINQKKYRFKVAAIAEPRGIFQEDGQRATMIMPRQKLADLFNAKNNVTTLFLTLINEEDVNQTIRRMSRLNPRFRVRQSISRAELKHHMSSLTTPFLLMTTLVLLISIFIIYSSFKVITLERLPMIGTLRSIGATKKMTDFFLIIESFLYGIIGGILGILLGLLILFVMTYIMSYNVWSNTRVSIPIQFTSFHILSAFLLALILSFISSIIPIIKASKIPIKEIILNKIESQNTRSNWKLYFGTSLLVLALLVPRFIPVHLALIVNLFCIIALITGVIFMVSYITRIFIAVFQNIYRYVLGNIGILAAKNLRENKNILNNIALLAIGISGILMINTISFSVTRELGSFYEDAHFNIWLWTNRANRKTLSRIRSVKGINGVAGVYSARNIEITNLKQRISRLHGVEQNILDYWKYDIDPEQIKQLNEKRNIILTVTLKEKFKVETGDQLVLKTKRGKKTYQVIGFFHTLRSGGRLGLVAKKYLKMDMLQNSYQEIYVRAGKNPDSILKLLQKKFHRRPIWLITVAEMKQKELQSNGQFFSILKGFSAITLIIGIFGVLNNYVISFLRRKRHLAIFRSIGMSKKQIFKMILIESLSGGLISGSTGLLTGFLLIFIVDYLLIALNMNMKIHYSPLQFICLFFASVLISLIASISPAIKSSKLNIIETIKYE